MKSIEPLNENDEEWERYHELAPTYGDGVSDAVAVLIRMRNEFLFNARQHPDRINRRNNDRLREQAALLQLAIDRIWAMGS